jgi:hypothetical protein
VAETRHIALWAVPRSVSTAFERVFIERDDAEVLHEPFSHAYYHGPDRRSDRFDVPDPEPAHAYEAVQAAVVAPCPAPIRFVKDMAYQARPVEDEGFFAGLINTFLIRDPEEALPSLHRMWPEITLQEAGYAEQSELFELVTETLEQPAVVVDATDFRREPDVVMAAYCEAADIAHRPEALQWQERPVDLWRGWAAWHRDAERSTGIRPPAPAAEAPLPTRVERMIEWCRPHYERLYAHRLNAT